MVFRNKLITFYHNVRHLRLELLEGVAAYHSCRFDKSREAINSARAKYFQVSLSFYRIGRIKLEYVIELNGVLAEISGLLYVEQFALIKCHCSCNNS